MSTDQPDILLSGELNEVELTDFIGRKIKPGDRVRLRSSHPHAGRVGIYRGVEALAGGLWGALIRFDDEGGCYIFKAVFWEKI